MEKRYIDQPRAAAAVRYRRAVSRGILAPTRILCRISESVFCPALFLAFANSHSSFLFAPAFQSSCKIRCSLAGSLSEICRKLAKSCSCIRMCPNVLSQVSLLVIILSQVFWFYSPIYWTVRQSGAWLSPRPGPGETERGGFAALPGPRAGRGRAALPRRLRAPRLCRLGPARRPSGEAPRAAQGATGKPAAAGGRGTPSPTRAQGAPGDPRSGHRRPRRGGPAGGRGPPEPQRGERGGREGPARWAARPRNGQGP